MSELGERIYHILAALDSEQRADMDARELANHIAAELKPCSQCEGTGTETTYVSDPDCGNCQYGDCDYGHPKEVTCWKCNGTGK